MMEYSFVSKSKENTRALGAFLAPLFERGDVVLLKGDLGAGKTTFAGGVAEGLGIKEDVISPTFNIMKCYFHGSIPLYHIDAYRLEGQNIEIGLDEYIEGDGVCLIEWPIYVESLLPEDTLDVVISNLGGQEREISLKGESPHFKDLINRVREAF